MKYAVIDIEYNNIRAVIAETGKTAIKVIKAYQINIPKELKTLDDKKIYIREKLADILSVNIRHIKVMVLAKGTDIIVRNYSFPARLKNKLNDAIKWKVIENSHLKEEDIIISFKVNKTKEFKFNSRMSVTCAASDFSAVNRYFDYFSYTPYKTPTIVLEAESIRCLAVQAEKNIQKETSAIIYIGPSFTNVVILREGELITSRVIPTGDENFTRVLAGETVVEGKTIKVSFEQAEILKKEIGIPFEDEENSAYSKILPPSTIKEMLQSLLEGFASEIERFFKFYKSETENREINTIYLIGPGTNLKNIDRYIGNRLEINSKKLEFDIEKSFKIKGSEDEIKVLKKNSKYFLTILGVLVCEKNSGGALKLYESPSVFKKSLITLKKFNALFLGIIFIIGYFFLQYKVIGLRNRANELEKKWKNLVTDYKDFFILRGKRINQNRALMAFDKMERESTIQWKSLLRELSLIIPDNMVFSKMSFKKLDGENGKIKVNLRIKGIVVDSKGRQEEIITNFILQLSHSNYFKNVDITYIEKDVLNPNITHFEIVSEILGKKK